MTWPAEHRNLSEAWIRGLRAPRLPDVSRERRYVTLEHVQALTSYSAPHYDLATVRDQAASALLFVSGMRVGALGSMPIRAFDLENRTVRQWPELGMRVKFGKKYITTLLNVPSLLKAIQRWDDIIRGKLSDTAMWYTPIKVHFNSQTLSEGPAGARRNMAIRKRIKLLSERAGVPYFHPHLFRHGSAVYALKRAKSMADYKAISQNLGHGDISTTDSTYAVLLDDEVRNRIDGLMYTEAEPMDRSLQASGRRRSPAEAAEMADMLRQIADQIANQLDSGDTEDDDTCAELVPAV